MAPTAGMLMAGTARRVVVERVAEVLTAARESRFKNSPTAPAARRIQTVFSLARPAAVAADATTTAIFVRTV